MRHKPILQPEDVTERFAFSKKYKVRVSTTPIEQSVASTSQGKASGSLDPSLRTTAGAIPPSSPNDGSKLPHAVAVFCLIGVGLTRKGKSKNWWLKKVHMHLDNHHFKVATTSRGRRLLAKRTVRGVYRKKGKSLRPGHVKPNPKMKLNTGPKGILKAGGVGGGRVLVWETIGGQWCGDAAEELYTDVVAPALKSRYRGCKSFSVLEDNDPTGNQSRKGVAAKVDSKIAVFAIPKRSPDLNVLDYAIWSEVERKMRASERKWPAAKRETRRQFEKRLDRTAKNLPKTFINKSIGDMKRRCKLLFDAKGGLFEEGGRSRRPL